MHVFVLLTIGEVGARDEKLVQVCSYHCTMWLDVCARKSTICMPCSAELHSLGCCHRARLQELTTLGQQLLSDGRSAAASSQDSGSAGAAGHASNNNIPTDLLVAAARQHLMSAEVLQLRLPHVTLLLADYQQLAASYYAHMMLSR